MDTLNNLQPLERIEEGLGELYERFVERFADDPDAAYVFKRLSLDEKSHASTLDAGRHLVPQDPAVLEAVEVDLEEIEALMERIEALRSHRTTDLVASVLGALELEEAAGRLHHGNARRQSVRGLARLFDYLGTCDERHAAELRQFARSRDFLPALSEP